MSSKAVSRAGTSAPPLRTALNRIDPLNFLRVYATLVVFVAHTNIFTNRLVWLGKQVFFMNAPAWAAMWFFYTLSGYLAGRSFLNQRSDFSLAFVGSYYYKKFLRVWLPTVVFIFISCVLTFPDFLPTNPIVIRNFFLCIYGSTWNNPAVDGVGATWFVFTLMWLYLSAPVWCFLASRIQTSRLMQGKPGARTAFYLAATALCLAAGEIWRQYCAWKGMDWFHYVYTPPYANVSMFAAGVFFCYLLADIRPTVAKRLSKVLSVVGLGGLLLFFSYMFYAYGVTGQTDGIWGRVWAFYHNSAPGAVCILTLFYIYAFDENGLVAYSPPTLSTVARNPLRLIDAFSGISFEFYLIHSLILNRISPFLKAESAVSEWIYTAGAAFLISTVLAILFSKMTEKAYSDFHLRHPVAWAREHPTEAGFAYFFVIVVVAAVYLVTLI